MIVTGVNEEGYREILGIMLGDSGSEASWSAFFSWLKGRDLLGTDVVVSDSQAGLVKALKAQFQGCTWQRCRHTLCATSPRFRDSACGRTAYGNGREMAKWSQVSG